MANDKNKNKNMQAEDRRKFNIGKDIQLSIILVAMG